MTTNNPETLQTQQISSYWSESICLKIPISRHRTCVENALWILRNPVRLTSLEKAELIALVEMKLSQQNEEKPE